MKKREFRHRGWMILTTVAVAISIWGSIAVGQVSASDLDKLDTSLKLIPSDAVFYSSMLHNREQIDAFLSSNAWAKIKSMPSVQMGLAAYSAQAQQPGSPVSRFEAAKKNPEIIKLINLVVDMGSNEIFVYGGKNFKEFIDLMQDIGTSMRYGPAVLQASGEWHGSNDKVQAKLLVDTLVEHTDLIAFPDVLIGFHLKNPAAANEALIKLEMFLNMAMEALPKLKGHLNKEKIGDFEYLVLRVDGKMVPWKELPMGELKDLVDDEKDFEKLVEHLKGMEFVLAMGVRGNDLLVSSGSTIDCIKNLGSTERLIDLPEFKPLEKFTDKQLTGIGYLSKDLCRQLNNNAKNIDDLRDFLVQMVPLAKLPEEKTGQIAKDVESLAGEITDKLPEMGSIMSFTFWTDKGYEGYQYNWSQHPDMDGSKPLGLLMHMGGNPILGIVGRGKVSIEHYDNMTKWINVVWKYMEELALPKIPDKDRAKVEALVNDVKPLVSRLNACTRDMLLPSLADGQIGFVIDAKLKSKQLHQSIPTLEQELPVPEPALVFGVSDAALLRKAVGELRGIYNDLIDVIVKQKDIPPEVVVNITHFKWPEAKVSENADGSVFSYPLPEQWGVDKNIVPNAGLSNEAAVLTISTKQTERMLKQMPLKVGGVLEKTDRPLAIAGWIDWTELVGAASPWVYYALEKMTDQQLGDQKQSVIAQVHTAFEVLSTIKSATSESYLEDKILVTHSLLEIHDLGK